MSPVGDGLALVLFVRKHGHDASVVKPIKKPLLLPPPKKKREDDPGAADGGRHDVTTDGVRARFRGESDAPSSCRCRAIASTSVRAKWYVWS